MMRFRNIYRVTVTTLGLCLLSGCLFGLFDKQLSRHTERDIWKAPFDTANGSPPVVMGDELYMASRDGEVCSFDIETGRTNWCLQTLRSIASSNIVMTDETDPDKMIDEAATQTVGWKISNSRPVIVDGLLHIGAQDTFYVVDSVTGLVARSFHINGWSYTEDIEASGMIYVHTTRKWRGSRTFVQAVDVGSGRVLWGFETWRDAEKTRQSHKSADLAFADGSVYMLQGIRQTVLFAVDRRTGEESWRYESDWSPNSKLFLVADLLLFATAKPPAVEFGRSDSTSFIAIEQKTGNVRWSWVRRGDPHIYRFQLVDGVGYFGEGDLGDDSITALDITTGTPKWQVSDVSNAYVIGNHLYTIRESGHGELVALDLLSGRPVWSGIKERNLFIEGLIDGVLYVTSGVHSGRLTAIDAATGEKLWTYYMDEPFEYGPIRWGNRLVFVTRSTLTMGMEPGQGYIYCIADQPVP